MGYNYEAVEGHRSQAKLLVDWLIDPVGHCQSASQLFNNTKTLRYALAIGYEYYNFPPQFGLVKGKLLNVEWYVMSSRDAIGLSQGNYYTTAETFPAYTLNIVSTWRSWHT
jgi:hypothetical protein